MTDYFEYFVKQEYPEGATPEQRYKVNCKIQELEDKIFKDLPFLVPFKIKPYPIEITENDVNDIVKFCYDLIREKEMN